MKGTKRTIACLLCFASCARAQNAPPTLVGLPGASLPPDAGFDFVTLLLWVSVAIGTALVAAVVWRWTSSRSARSVRSSAVFVTMCRGLKLTAADQRLLKQLASGEEAITPVTMILCPSVFERAAARAGRAVNKESLHRLRQRLAG